MRGAVMRLGRRFARTATNAVVRQPRLWPLFRPLVARQFDWLAPKWDAIRSPDHLSSFGAALAAVDAQPRRVLDLGTGTGDAAFLIARCFPGAEVVGADLAAEMVEHARRKTPPELAGRVRFVQADSASLPFADEEFDLVGLANMIPFFDELARVVAPGGYAVFGFSAGAQTPIYVPFERLRRELAERGFAEFTEFAVGPGTALLAHKAKSP